MLSIPLSLLAAHFVGDFLLQSDWMALNKSKSWKALACHCLVYSSVFLWFGWKFAATTFLLHFLTDAVTSRITSKLWFVECFSTGQVSCHFDPKKRHWFFVMIGFDQLIHYGTLAWTLRLVS